VRDIEDDEFTNLPVGSRINAIKDLPNTDVCIRNLINWNDWKLSDFLAAVIGIQVLVWAFIALGTAGIHVPLLRPAVGFAYCCFVPGIVLLRTLNLHYLGTIETLLYSVGLSIGIVYLTGIFVNIGLPFLGIGFPLSEIYLTLTISAVTIILCTVCYLQKDGTSVERSEWRISDILTVPNMSLLLVPFTAIFGTTLVNTFHINHLLLIMVIILVSVVILAGLDKFIHKEAYPIAVFAISVTLLLHTALITPYLWGWDIVDENFYATIVLEHQIWNTGIFHNVNGCLSIVVLAPILSQLTELPLTWVFKLLYPLIFSLIAVALYQIYCRQIGDRIAFFACLMFVSYFQYYNGMIFLARQMIAEIFFVLLLLLMVSNTVTGRRRAFLMGFFGFSMITSHYGLSFLFMGALIAAWLLILIAGSNPASKIGVRALNFLGRTDAGLMNFLNLKEKRTILTAPFVIPFSLFTIGWYSLVASGSVLNSVTRIINQIVSSLITELADPATSQGMNMIVRETATPLHEIWKYLFLITNLFIIFGFLVYLFRKSDHHRFTREYIALASVFLTLDVASVTVPYLASALSIERFYQITIIILSPFFAYGGLAVFSMVVNRSRDIFSGPLRSRHAYAMLSVFLAVFLIFNTGFIYEVTGDSPTSIALSTVNDPPYPKFNDREMTGAQWLHQHVSVEGNRNLLADTKGQLLLRLNLVDWMDLDSENTYQNLICPPTHVDPLFLHTVNMEDNVAYVSVIEKATTITRELNVTWLTQDRSKVYGNGGSEAYI